MEKRIQELIKMLNGLRDAALTHYLNELANFNAEKGSTRAVEAAGILHDLDKHVTNLEMEMKRIQSLERVMTNG